QSVGEIDRMTQQNAALVEESAAAAESLREQAQRLSQVVQQFHLADAGAGQLGRSRATASVPQRAMTGHITPRLAA
ncbi:MAG TPA: methyl-accepting chemotaxis protein, partial [Acidovorax sp.]|nr:methyl-accepting chemotaxis protein [Acidovorax sp.]